MLWGSRRCDCSRRRSRSSQSGNRRWGYALQNKLTDDFPFQPDKDLHFVVARLPFLRRRCPFGKTVAAGLAIPWNGLIVNKFAIAKPQGGPLRTGDHLGIRENRTHIINWVLKHGRRGELNEV